MPSAVGPEAMRDWLFIHGIRRPAVLNEAMRVIDQYVAFRVLQRWPELAEGPPPPVPATPQAWKNMTFRGDPDMEIRCSHCKQVKKAEGNFYHRNDTTTGWGRKCIECIVPPQAERVTMVCKSCRKQEHGDCPGGTWCDCQHVDVTELGKLGTRSVVE